MVYTRPGEPGSLVSRYRSYDNFIGGIRVAPVDGEYFDSISSADCRALTNSCPKPDIQKVHP